MITNLRKLPLVRKVIRALGVQRVDLGVRIAALPVSVLLGPLLRRLPRDKNLLVFGSPLDRFADNSAYLFAHVSQHEAPTVKSVWISGSQRVVDHLRGFGYQAEHRWSYPGLRAILRAGTFVYSGYPSDISRWFHHGATTICLWHGLPIKRIERDVAPSSGSTRFPMDWLWKWSRDQPPDFLLSSTKFVTTDCFISAFGIPAERCWELGYPRNDHLVTAPDDPPYAALVSSPEAWKVLHDADRVVGLFLTWRDDQAADIAAVDFLVDEIAGICARNGAVLAYKTHYNVAGAKVSSENCVSLPPDGDLNAYLGLCDLLISDYSSTALDFLLLGRPIMYYLPDVEEYRASRGFYLEPLDLPGVVCLDRQELTERLDAILSGRMLPPEPTAYASLRENVWGAYDGHSCEALAGALKSLRGSSTADHDDGDRRDT
jgi:CDP-glycerol glycerophosphotransferase (TagB/SpsB family)